MNTYLEKEYQENRNILSLFPLVKQVISCSSPNEAYNIVKQNKRIDNIPPSEIFDAFWWCLYGFLYSTEDERVNSLPHDDYFYNADNFKNDTKSILKCEMLRCESKIHRYPIPKRNNNVLAKKKIKLFNEYYSFINETIIRLFDCDTPHEMRTPEMYKVWVDMIRSSQERLLGNNPDDVSNLRKTQFLAIGNFLDDVFIHRGYIHKIKDDGAEVFTPEQLEEWETSKKRIKQHCDNNNNLIPGFIRNMINYSGFIIETIN